MISFISLELICRLILLLWHAKMFFSLSHVFHRRRGEQQQRRAKKPKWLWYLPSKISLHVLSCLYFISMKMKWKWEFFFAFSPALILMKFQFALCARIEQEKKKKQSFIYDISSHRISTTFQRGGKTHSGKFLTKSTFPVHLSSRRNSFSENLLIDASYEENLIIWCFSRATNSMYTTSPAMPARRWKLKALRFSITRKNWRKTPNLFSPCCPTTPSCKTLMKKWLKMASTVTHSSSTRRLLIPMCRNMSRKLWAKLALDLSMRLFRVSKLMSAWKVNIHDEKLFCFARLLGGVMGAQNATLTFMVGGTEAEYNGVKDFLGG